MDELIRREVVILKDVAGNGFKVGSLAVVVDEGHYHTPRKYLLLQDGRTEWIPETDFGKIEDNMILKSKVEEVIEGLDKFAFPADKVPHLETPVVYFDVAKRELSKLIK